MVRPESASRAFEAAGVEKVVIGYFVAMIQGLVRGEGARGPLTIEKTNATCQRFESEYARRKYEVVVYDRGPVESFAVVENPSERARRILNFRPRRGV